MGTKTYVKLIWWTLIKETIWAFVRGLWSFYPCHALSLTRLYTVQTQVRKWSSTTDWERTYKRTCVGPGWHAHTHTHSQVHTYQAVQVFWHARRLVVEGKFTVRDRSRTHFASLTTSSPPSCTSLLLVDKWYGVQCLMRASRILPYSMMYRWLLISLEHKKQVTYWRWSEIRFRRGVSMDRLTRFQGEMLDYLIVGLFIFTFVWVTLILRLAST